MEFDLKLTKNEIELLYQALGKLPLEVSGVLFTKIQHQVIKQEAAPARKAKVGGK